MTKAGRTVEQKAIFALGKDSSALNSGHTPPTDQPDRLRDRLPAALASGSPTVLTTALAAVPGVTPAQFGLQAWNGDVMHTGATITPAAATIYLQRVEVPVAVTLTNLIVCVGTAGTSYTNAQLGVYSSAGVFLKATAVQASAGTNGFGVTGVVSIALTSAQLVGPGFVWLAFHAGTNSATAIILNAFGATNIRANAGLAAATARAATQTGHATNDLATIGNLTVGSNVINGTTNVAFEAAS